MTTTTTITKENCIKIKIKENLTCHGCRLSFLVIWKDSKIVLPEN